MCCAKWIHKNVVVYIRFSVEKRGVEKLPYALNYAFISSLEYQPTIFYIFKISKRPFADIIVNTILVF